MRALYKLILLMCASIMAMGGMGCTHMRTVEPNITVVHAKTPVQASVALLFDKSLDNFDYNFSMMVDKWHYPFGPALKDYARNVTSAVFKNVSVLSSPAEIPGRNADIVLTLKAGKAEQTMPSSMFGKRKFTLIVEWTARDRTNTKDLWIKTITGCAEETRGHMFNFYKHEKLLFQKVFYDLNKKTVDAMMQSPELARAGR